MGFLWSHCKWLAIYPQHLLLKRISCDHTGVQSRFHLLSLASHPPLLPLWLSYKVSISCLLSVFISFFHFPFKSTLCLTHVVSLFFSFLVFSVVTICGWPPFGIGSVRQSVLSACWVFLQVVKSFPIAVENKGLRSITLYIFFLKQTDTWWKLMMLMSSLTAGSWNEHNDADAPAITPVKAEMCQKHLTRVRHWLRDTFLNFHFQL